MANEITLSVKTNEAEALLSLNKIDEAASALSKTPYKLTFDISGVQNIDKQLTSALNAQARYIKAQAELQKAQSAGARAAAEQKKAEAELQKQYNASAVEAAKVVQEEAKLNRERQKTLTQAEKTRTEEQKTAQQREKTAQANTKLATQEERTRTEAEKTNRVMLQQESALQRANTAAGSFVLTLGKLAAVKAINLIKQQFQEALTTMREVDQEMANIAKVSNYSDAQLAQINEAAYGTASKYGVGVTSYLSSTAQWAKAGYENATDLAELSTKLELVGDVSSTVASQFLLSADAAWKFGGNIQSLSKVIDEANVIENNYATSIAKISEGLPIVASTAAMAGMSMEQTMAALGTITARTQESGRKAATALRSLILNITKQVGAEIEDGVEVTEESVKSLYGLLEKYAPAAVEAARATGEIVNPMEAIASLAQAARDGLMTQQEMFDLLNSLGGKLRVNQLMTLVNGFETYEEMLVKVEDAAGSADKEVQRMLETWNAKVNILKNSWTELLATFGTTKAVKNVLDYLNMATTGLTTLVRYLGGNAERIGSYKGEGYFWWNGIVEDLELSTEQAKILFDHWKGLAKEGATDLDFFDWLEKDYKKSTASADENTDALQENTYAEAENAAAASEVADALDGARKARDAFTDSMKEEEKDDVFQSYASAFKTLQQEIDAGRVNSNAFWASAEFLFGPEVLDAMGRDAAEIAAHAAEIAPAFDDAGSAGRGLLGLMEDMADENGNILDSSGKIIATIRQGEDGGWEWGIADADALAEKLGLSADAVVALQSAMGVFSDVAVTESKKAEDAQTEVKEAADDTTESLERIDSIGFEAVTGGVHSLGGALQDAKRDADLLSESLYNIEFAPNGVPVHTYTGGYASGTQNAAAGNALVNERGPELISDRGRAFIAGGGAPTVVNLSRGATVFTAEQTRSILGNPRNFGSIPAHASGRNNHVWILDAEGNQALVPMSYTGNLNKTPGSIPSSDGGGGGGGGGGSAGTDMKSVKDALDALLKNLDLQAKLAKNEERYADMNDLYRQAQDEIQKVVDQYLAEGYEETSDEVLTLKNLIYDYAGKMQDLAGQGWKDLESALDKALDNIDAEIKLAKYQGNTGRMLELYAEAQQQIEELLNQYLAAGYAANSPEVLALANKGYKYASDQQSLADSLWNDLVDAIEALKDATDDANELAEKQLAVDEARAAYENAQRQRTVRIFNPETGQWEWVADQSQVSAAQKALQNAQKDLGETQEQQFLGLIRNGGLSLSEILAASPVSAHYDTASAEAQAAFLAALGGYYGAVDRTASSTATSMFQQSSTDSHDTHYSIGGVNITREQAASMTLAQLADLLRYSNIA